MTPRIWQAFYYDDRGANAAPVRSELIEAKSENAALALARQRAGQARRIELGPPCWERVRSSSLSGEDGVQRA